MYSLGHALMQVFQVFSREKYAFANAGTQKCRDPGLGIEFTRMLN